MLIPERGHILGGTLLLFLLAPMLAFAAPERLEMPSGTEVAVEVYPGQGRATLLWLPSERGFDAAQREHAESLARLGHPVWLADLHENYFVQPGRTSITHFPLEDIVALVEAAAAAADGKLILLSGGRGAQLALIAAREWQLRNPGKDSIRGIILLHAHLYQARPAPGQDAVYLPIVGATNLPVYLIAAEYSTKYSRQQELASAFGNGSGAVYTQVFADVQGGFHSRSDDRIGERDIEARQAFPATLSRAAGLLLRTATPTVALASNLDTRRLGEVSHGDHVLTPIARPKPAPVLRLKAIDGDEFALDGLRGRVVLVNFWASWCRPCVTEIPSLHRLAAALDDTDFQIVTVNVGEDRERVQQFLQRVPVDLPLLMDYDSSASKDWMIYVYPSSYLVDRQGVIRYAYLGALEWDSAEIVEIIRALLSQS